DFDEVWDVFLRQSKVYFCTFKGIYIYDGSQVSFVDYPGGLDRSFLVNGKLYTQDQTGKLYEVDGESLQSGIAQNQSNQIVAGMLAVEGGTLLIDNSGEIELSSAFGVSRIYPQLIEALSGKYVNHVLQLSDTRLAIATQTAGLFLFDLQQQSIENITTRDGLLSNACLRSFQDYSGNLWVGMQNGMALIDISSPMRFINQDINLQGSGYDAFETAEGVYYTTSNGIYFLAKGGTQASFLEGTEGPAYDLQQVAGQLYAGHHTGLFRLQQGQATRVARTDGLWQIKQLRTQPSYAIAGTYSGLFLFKLNEQLQPQAVQKIAGFDESSRFFEEDDMGHVWVGQFYKGLFKLQLSADLSKAEVRKIVVDDEVPVDEQIILSLINNQLHLGTKKGVYKIDPTTERIEPAALFSASIGEQQVYLLKQDRQKNIHIYADNVVGFYKQISPNNFAFVPSSLYQLRYFFNNDLLNLSANTNLGVLINANEGFIQYRPEQENRIGLRQPLVISKVFSVTEDSVLYARPVFGKADESLPELTISHRAKVLQFEVQSFEFGDVGNQQFRYLLKGFDEHYSDWTRATMKEYTNLREGNYEFMVQTRNKLGAVIDGQALPLEVRPPFHRSMLARVLYFLLGAAFLMLIIRQERMKTREKTAAIEAEKQQELVRQQQQLEAIEKQKEQELLQLEETNIKNELRHLNNLLAASTMNLVVKNEFIVNIKEKIQDANRKGRSQESKTALDQIVKEIDSTLRLQEDWEQFEYHFDKVHGDFLNRLRVHFHDLTPNEQKLCAFLRLKLNTKDIANLMGVSQRGIEIARYRLRKKLDLSKGDNLSKFILEF
ncbi:MAG: triple tyrosine motif-containing protein, partial [Bacteroidota bacterium]